MQRIGPRIPMTIGPVLAAGGFILLTRIGAQASYVSDVLPGVVVIGLGLAVTVAPLTATALSSVEPRHAGIASGVNNAIARLAGLLAVALLPVAGGLDSTGTATSREGFALAIRIAAATCAIGGCIAFVTLRER
jgi:hypothetical protein